jgi:hypothetical protein
MRRNLQSRGEIQRHAANLTGGRGTKSPLFLLAQTSAH